MSTFQRIRSAGSALGIRFKLAAVMTLGMVVTFALAFGLTVANQRATFDQIQQDQGNMVVKLLAGEISAATQFRDSDRITEVLQNARDMDQTILAVDVIHVSGEQLVSLNSMDVRAADLSDGMTQILEAHGQSEDHVSSMLGTYLVGAAPIFSKRGNEPIGVLVMAWDSAPTRAEIMSKTMSAIALSAILALLGLGLIVFVIGRIVTRPVQTLNTAMEAIQDHQYDVEIPALSRADEIGAIARRLSSFRDTLVREQEQQISYEAEVGQRRALFERLAQGLSDLADGHLDRPVDVSEFEGLDKLQLTFCENFNAVLGKLNYMMSSITQTAESVRNSSAEIADVVVDQSKRSEAQAVTLEESSEAIETLSASVDQIAGRAADANDRILLNRKQAQAGGEVVSLAVDAMNSIEHSSDQITAIIGVIDDIAFQTNLLALNAGVEAARAGEAGRGFAVVASEVRALAQRASESANEIKELIERSGEQVTNGSTLVRKAGTALNEIIDGVNHASELVSQIASSSREQANNLAEIRDSVSELDRVTQQNAAIIEESSAASRSLTKEASRMTDILNAFNQSGKASSRSLESWDKDLEQDQADAARTRATADAEMPEARVKQAAAPATGWEDF